MCLSFDPRGTLIATGSMDNTAKLWDVETGKERATLMGHTAEIVSLNFNTAGDRVITGSFDHTVKVWDVNNDFKLLETIVGHKASVLSITYSPLSKLIATAGRDSTIKVWSASTWTCERTLEGHTSAVVSLAVCGDKLISGSSDNTIKVWGAGGT